MGFLRRALGGKNEERGGGAKPAALEPRHLTGEEFEALVASSEQPVVVDFWAEWCGPCKMIAPSVATLATEFDGRAVVAKLNADDYQDVLGRLGIRGIPTLIYFKGGREVDRQVGVASYAVLRSKLERLLA